MHLLLQKSGEEAEDLVGQRLRHSVIGRVTSRRSNVAQVGVGRRKRHLAKLVKVQLLVLIAVKLADDIIGIGHARTQIVLAHEVVELRNADLAIATPVNVLEKFHGLEIGVSAQVLPLHLNLSEYAQHNALVIINPSTHSTRAKHLPLSHSGPSL